MVIKVKLDPRAKMPTKAHSTDAGFDLCCAGGGTVWPHDSLSFDTGVHFDIPAGYVGFLKSKSGLNVKFSLQSEGVIDAGYTGSVVVKVYNHSYEPYHFNAGDKLTQIVFLPIPSVELEQTTDDFAQTDRGDKGFGSSGK